VSEDAPGHDGSAGDADGWDATSAPTTGSTPRIDEPVPHSRLVGLMAEPVSGSVPFRRSTVLMLVAFLGFGTLSYLYPPNGSSTSPSGSGGGVPGYFVPSSTTSTTHPATTTTTTHPGGTPTSTTSTATSTRPGGSTTTTTTSTTRPVGTTTTTAPGATTTTVPGAPTTTTSTAAP
jgi:hypothetical protein